jgi:prepilin-type N-terminal cleavage/methylation domain-containing protein
MMTKRSTTRPRRRRGGFTLAEMLISMTLLAAVLGVSVRLFQTQTRQLGAQSRRFDAQRNASYAISIIERELRVAGVGTTGGQPVLVAVAPRALVFNVNLVSADSQDAKAVYLNPDADSGATGVFRVEQQLPIPTLTGVAADLYPDTTYTDVNRNPSRAETIAFWFSRDSTARDTTEHILWRRVNATRPEVVARGLLIAATDTVFQYFKADSLDQLTAIPTASLPLTHVAKLHGEVPDTGRLALVDSVRLVKMRLRSLARDARGEVSVRRVEAVVRVLNGGMARRTTCGTAPLAPSPAAALAIDATGAPTVVVSWAPAIDESGGERDVERYVIYRRKSTDPAFAGEPITSIPAGQPSYSWVDTAVRSGEQWVYGVAAQDCSPTNSAAALTSIVVIP